MTARRDDAIGSYESHLTLAATPSAPFWARRHTADVLNRWGLIELVGTAGLVVTEIMTNGVKASGVEMDAGGNEFGQECGASAEEVALRDEPPRSAEELIVATGEPVARTDGRQRGTRRRHDTLPPMRRPGYTELASTPVIRLRLSTDRTRSLLLIEVWDKSPEPPVLRRAEPESVSGRGLVLVEAFCEQWGWWWPERSVHEGRPWPRPLDKATVRGLRESGAEWTAGKVVWGSVARMTAEP